MNKIEQLLELVNKIEAESQLLGDMLYQAKLNSNAKMEKAIGSGHYFYLDNAYSKLIRVATDIADLI